MDKLIFDSESTGLSTTTDRIIQLAIKVISEDGSVLVSKSKLYNPGIPISKSAFDTHGISDNDVKDCPTFASDALKLKKLFENKVIIGYNILKFDVPLLMAEFKRAKVDVNLSGKFLDVLNIEKKLNSNSLANAYKRYCGKDLEGGHDAMVDVNATELIFNYQSKIIDNLKDIDIYELSGTKELLDMGGKLKRDAEGYLIFNFGKSKGLKVINDPKYAAWILTEDFPNDVKDLIRTEQTKHMIQPKIPSTKVNSTPTLINWKSSKSEEIQDDLPF